MSFRAATFLAVSLLWPAVAAAQDTAPVTVLGEDLRSLRAAFAAAQGKARLMVLVSPT